MASGTPALFTDQQPAECERSNCPNKEAGRPAPPVNFMVSARQGMGLRWLCAQCFEYYQSKSAAAGLGVTAYNSVPASVLPDHSRIRQDNAAGQRGELGRSNVLAMGPPQLPIPHAIGAPPFLPSLLPGHPMAVPPLPLGHRMGLGPPPLLGLARRATTPHLLPPPQPRASSSSSLMAGSGLGPTVHVHGLSHLQQLAAYLKQPPTGELGYKPVHELYGQIRGSLRSEAFRGTGGAEVVVIQAQMVVMQEGRKRPTAVAAVRESIPHVPARIGAQHLKIYVCAALFPLFFQWSGNTSLTMDQCKLRSSQWVEIVAYPNDADYDAISDGLYVPKGKGSARTLTFKLVKGRSPTVEVLLEIPLDIYNVASRQAGKQVEDDDADPSGSEGGEALYGYQLRANDDAAQPVMPQAELRVQEPRVQQSISYADDAAMARAAEDDDVDRELGKDPVDAVGVHRRRRRESGVSTSIDSERLRHKRTKPMSATLSDLEVQNVTRPLHGVEESAHARAPTAPSTPSAGALSTHARAPSPSPSATVIERALRQQQGPSRAIALGYLHSTDVLVTVQVCPKRTFSTLLEQAQAMHKPGAGRTAMWSHGIERFKSTLTFNAQAKPSIGGFKLSVYGVTQPIPPGFASGQVAVKQCYERANGRVRKPLGTLDHTLAAGVLKYDPSIFVLESGDQIVHLSREIICAQWADALMNMVYDRMASWEVKMGRRCPYDVPQLRFVRVGLAMEDRPIGTSLSSTSSSSQFSRAVYMLEEFIDASTHGVWRKYINNNSALPLPLPEKLWNDREERTRREFLVFAQHVQYSVTKGLAYVSDFQGAGNLLSDPQILTNPVLGGNIFGDGNLSSAFENFKDEHDCSKFCWFFKLETLKTVSAVGRSGSVRNSEGNPSRTAGGKEKESAEEESLARRTKGKGAMRSPLFFPGLGSGSEEGSEERVGEGSKARDGSESKNGHDSPSVGG